MKKTLAALFGTGAVLLAAACGSSGDSGSAAEGTTESTTAAPSTSQVTGSTGIELGQSYDQICSALVPYFDQLESWGQDRTQAATSVADAQKSLPGWAELSEEQQAETLRAVENAGKGQC